MRLDPEAPLSSAALTAVAESYGLGEPRASQFIARGAMGAIHRITTRTHGRRAYWAVKRAYWDQFTEDAIEREVAFTTQCQLAGVPAPRAVRRIDDGGFVLSVDDQAGEASQYRVMSWVDGETGDPDDDRTVAPLMEWMARIHNLAVDSCNQKVDDWFVSVQYDWDELIERLECRASDMAAAMRLRGADLHELTSFVNSVCESGTVWCHTDIGADNLIWSDGTAWLIDWENAGPLVPHQELGSFVRSLGSRARARKAYQVYRRAGGPAVITELAHLASSVATHLNYLGCQSELLLDPAHPEQHEFAQQQVHNAAQNLPSMRDLREMIDGLNRKE